MKLCSNVGIDELDCTRDVRLGLLDIFEQVIPRPPRVAQPLQGCEYVSAASRNHFRAPYRQSRPMRDAGKNEHASQHDKTREANHIYPKSHVVDRCRATKDFASGPWNGAVVGQGLRDLEGLVISFQYKH